VLVQDLVSLSMRTSGILGVGQVPLAQDQADAISMLQLMMQQWRQKRWLVFRLDWTVFTLEVGKQSYTIGPSGPPLPDPVPDVTVYGVFRPANIQSCFLRQNFGSSPSSFPIDFPMRILGSRQEYDSISLKSLQSWPINVYYDPTIPLATLYIWPIPIQTFFSLYIAWQIAIDVASEESLATDLSVYVPSETQLALMYNLAELLALNYKLPPDPNLQAAARATLNVLRQTNFAIQPARMPSALRARGRLRNPMGGFNYPEINAGVPIIQLGG
jgi:hypothetical protein